MRRTEPDGRATPTTELAQRIAAIRDGQRGAIARAITGIENDAPAAQALVAALQPYVGRAHIVGITGAPGAGKSTLINALLHELALRGRRVAVAAVDPSSPITGGAVLGDRIRMSDAGAAESVFIRSLASRGHLGGLGRTTRHVVDLLDAAGFDIVIVETVGAGQSEVDIATLADTSVVVCPPGLGDDVQAIKAGILEIADVLVVNKGDQPLADRTERDLKDMLHLRARRAGWPVQVLRTIATTGDGVAKLADALAAHATESGVGRRLPHAEAPASAPDPLDASGAAVRALAATDRFLRHSGIEFVTAGPGTATLRMRVETHHLNFNGSCHGGAIFSLADSAFGLASNSHGVIAAGINAHITYQVAVRAGDALTACATEVSRTPKLAVYRVDVTRSDGTAVASFTGSVYITKRPHTATTPLP
jgi:LAO/AO transport system kinase